jgi:hypothetical protein
MDEGQQCATCSKINFNPRVVMVGGGVDGGRMDG